MGGVGRQQLQCFKDLFITGEGEKGGGGGGAGRKWVLN